MFKTMLTTIVRAIEMFRVADGMVLMMVVEAFDGGGRGVDRRENLAKISDPTLWEGGVVIQMANNKDKKNNNDTRISEPTIARAVRLLDMIQLDPSTSVSVAKNGYLSGN